LEASIGGIAQGGGSIEITEDVSLSFRISA
jgi:hypothetical protein